MSSSSARDAGRDVDAVHAEIGQLAEDLRLRLAVLAERDSVEVRGSVDHVEPQAVRRRLDVALHALVQLGELLLDRRMAGRVEAREPSEADESLEEGDRVQAVRF